MERRKRRELFGDGRKSCEKPLTPPAHTQELCTYAGGVDYLVGCHLGTIRGRQDG